LSQALRMLYDIFNMSSMGISNVFSFKGFIGCSMVYYASCILSSNASFLYFVTDIFSSLCDSSFRNSHSCKECLQRADLIDISNACMTSSLCFGIKTLPHFLEIHPLRRFLLPILDCEANASFRGG
jgi:hypothetical protein